MDRIDLVTAALAAGGHRARFLPVHVQKLLFLIDRELASQVGGPHFEFKPFHYGPFDREVYRVLDELAVMGRLDRIADDSLISYRLTRMGQAAGDAILAACRSEIATCLGECARWVRIQTFRSLVAEIYARYPDTEANSRVPDLVKRAQERRRARSKSRAFMRGVGSILDLAPRSAYPVHDSIRDALADDWHAIGDDWRNLAAPYPKWPQ